MSRIVSVWITVFALITILGLSQIFARQQQSISPGSLSARIPSGLVQMIPKSRYYSPYAFVVDKKARQLTVWQRTEAGLTPITQLPADLGKASGDKMNRGDHRTPEGIYFFLELLEGPGLDFSLYGQRAFTLDYPNFFDRLQGKTGSGIWLHAVPDDVPLTRGSRGCVVVRNDAILNLTSFVKLKRTAIIIHEETKLTTQDALSQQSSEFNQLLESWRKSWEQKDLNSYISYYGEDFRSMNMNRAQWRTFKSRLNRQYQSIQVKLSQPMIFTSDDNAIVRFLQEYSSDQHTDFGEKTLYLKKKSDGFKIVGESWEAEDNPVARDEVQSSLLTTESSSCLSQDAGDCEAAPAPSSTVPSTVKTVSQESAS